MLSAVESPTRKTELEPIDRRSAGTSGVFAVVLAVTIVIAYEQWTFGISRVYIAYSRFLPEGRWRLAYPNPE